ncbi:UNVERIFIED_CONTAM: hypothetical protein Scaly_1616200 [Sesamum calycinum]|uniref:Retrotransposon gag domain-containing protein n=1 Tax=Sesamum calycinum TaxID=2727403 RepID=A0AAW2P7Z8_9LAMI
MDTHGKAVKPVNSKLAISKSSSSSIKSVGVITRNMSKKLKESSQMYPLAAYVEKNLHSPSYASESDVNKSPPTSPCFVSSYSFTTNVAPVMVINATTIEEQLADLTRAIEGLMKHVQEQDTQIARLINKADISMQAMSWGNKLRLMMKNHHKQGQGRSRSSFTYSKPYTPRIDSLKMPIGTYDDHLVNQFVRSLKGNAFDWYTDLEGGSINGWEHLEQEFLNRFYNTRRTVSMVELTNSRQWKEKPVVDYINRWRNLSLNCKDRLSETSAIEMCIQGMHWELCYILQAIKSKTFEELATRAHGIEMSFNCKEDEYSVDPNDDDELEKEEPSKETLQNSLYAIPQVTELEKEEPSKGRFQNSLYAIPQVTGLEKEELSKGRLQNSHFQVIKYQSRL